MREPTYEEVEANARIETEESAGYACWYPQMGGYVGKCIVVPTDAGCFDAFVWHDGEFPFSAESGDFRPPARVHHCDPGQFIQFGRFVERIIDENFVPPESAV